MSSAAPTRLVRRLASDRRSRVPTAVLVAALLIVALAVRVGYVVATPGYVAVNDAHDYDLHARSISRGHGYARIGPGPSRQTAFRPPGYPYFLAGVYRVAGAAHADAPRRAVAGRVGNALVGTAIVALIGLLGARLFGRRVALVAMALGAVYVPLVLAGGALMSEPLFAALLLGALVAALHPARSGHRLAWAAVAGVAAGLMILTRANSAILLAPLAVAVRPPAPWRSWRALVAPAVLVTVALMTVAPWTGRNAVVLHRFIPVSTQLGWALAGTYNDQARGDHAYPASWRSLRHIAQYQPLVRHARWRTVPEPQLERELRAAALRYARRHPAYVAEVAWWDTRRMLDLAGLGWSRHTAATISVKPGWSDAGVVCFWLCALLAIAGALTARGRRMPLPVAAIPVLLYLSVVFLVVETPRYRTGIDPFIVLLAAVAIVTAADRVAVMRRSTTAPQRPQPSSAGAPARGA